MHEGSVIFQITTYLLGQIKKRNARRRTLVFQQNNSTSHQAKYKAHCLANRYCRAEKIMTWSTNSRETHPIKTLWHSLKGRSIMMVSNLQTSESILPSDIATVRTLLITANKIINVRICHVQIYIDVIHIISLSFQCYIIYIRWVPIIYCQ